jgi:hypothetical protein
MFANEDSPRCQNLIQMFKRTVQDELQSLADKGWAHWTLTEVVCVREIKRKYPSVFEKVFGDRKSNSEMLSWPRKKRVKKPIKIIRCPEIPGVCCSGCHKMEQDGKLGLQVASSRNGDKIFYTCCYKLGYLEDRKEIAPELKHKQQIYTRSKP